MNPITNLVSLLRDRPDVEVIEESQSWSVYLPKGDLRVEVTIPHSVLEWHACAVNPKEKKKLWSDWMDYQGYDKRSKDKLEEEMAGDILAFVERVSIRPLAIPLSIHEESEPGDPRNAAKLRR